MDPHPRVPENARDCREIERLTFLGEYDGAAVEVQAHTLSAERDTCQALGLDPAPRNAAVDQWDETYRISKKRQVTLAWNVAFDWWKVFKTSVESAIASAAHRPPVEIIPAWYY